MSDSSCEGVSVCMSDYVRERVSYHVLDEQQKQAGSGKTFCKVRDRVSSSTAIT